jgi:hypothetical protein
MRLPLIRWTLKSILKKPLREVTVSEGNLPRMVRRMVSRFLSETVIYKKKLIINFIKTNKYTMNVMIIQITG